MPNYTYQTTVKIDLTTPSGNMKHYIPIPRNIAQTFQYIDVERVTGNINDYKYKRALQSRPSGSQCLKFGVMWLSRRNLDVGTPVTVTISRDRHPHRVDLPDELAAALDADPAALNFWETLTPAKQRTLTFDIAGAKRPEKRQRLAQTVIEELQRM